MTVPHAPVPCLSVVVPCFNEEETIAELLHRVLEQPWTAEVIVVDDGSTDATPELLAALGGVIETTLEGLGWEDTLLGILPALESDLFSLRPLGVTHDPMDVTLVPVQDGITLAITLPDLEIAAEIESAALDIALDVAIGYDAIALGATLVPATDADGVISLGLASSTFELGVPTLQFGGFDPVFLEDLLGGLDDVVADLGAGLIDVLLGSIGELALPSLETEIDLLGTLLSTSVAGLGADPDGAWVALGLGLDGPPGEVADIPVPSSGSGDLAVALHEGLFQLLLASDLLALLEQDLSLSQPFAGALTLPLQALPGGTALPESDTWCLTIALPEAKVARVTPGEDTIAKLYLPDTVVTFSYDLGAGCVPWLTASLALELGVEADGSVLGFDLAVADGAVLAYAAPGGPYEEDEIIVPLGATLEALLGLLGGTLEIDLADLLGGFGGTASGTGGLLGGLELAPRVIGSAPLLDATGAEVPGFIVMDVELF
ncbi:MAG: glycosyltransferase [Deltaproteobacteria bacterium]|nr:glycosyltransferase [Deltaproteobacteria bacterium]